MQQQQQQHHLRELFTASSREFFLEAWNEDYLVRQYTMAPVDALKPGHQTYAVMDVVYQKAVHEGHTFICAEFKNAPQKPTFTVAGRQGQLKVPVKTLVPDVNTFKDTKGNENWSIAFQHFGDKKYFFWCVPGPGMGSRGRSACVCVCV